MHGSEIRSVVFLTGLSPQSLLLSVCAFLLRFGFRTLLIFTLYNNPAAPESDKGVVCGRRGVRCVRRPRPAIRGQREPTPSPHQHRLLSSRGYKVAPPLGHQRQRAAGARARRRLVSPPRRHHASRGGRHARSDQHEIGARWMWMVVVVCSHRGGYGAGYRHVDGSEHGDGPPQPAR
jgi:hypothetical protein